MEIVITEHDYVHVLLKEAGEKGMTADEFRNKLSISYREAKTALDEFAKVTNRAAKDSIVKVDGKGINQRYYLTRS